MPISRRDFLSSTLAGSITLGLQPNALPASETKRAAKLPIIISAWNGYNYLDEGYALLAKGGDTLDAALKVVQGPENDPNDESVGLGGHPNEEGVVELDACCMHGPTRTAGSVGGVRNIKDVSLVSNAVRQHTGHVMLVGEGAERFAVAQGFPRENLLTDKSRKEWLLWKETHSENAGNRSRHRNSAGAARGSDSLCSLSADRDHSLFCPQRERRDFRLHHYERIGVEDTGQGWRLSHHRRGLRHRSGRRIGRRDGQWRRKH